MKKYFTTYFMVAIVSIYSSAAWAAETPPSSSSLSDVSEANNPLSHLIAVNLQNYYVTHLSESDGVSNQFNFRVVAPFWRILPRLTLPIANVTTADTSTSGIGDLNLFVAFLFTESDAPHQFGIGPLYTAPTATDTLGTGKHQIGLSAVSVNMLGPAMFGALVLWQMSVAGDSDRPDTNNLEIQPFLTFQVGQGFYLRMTGTATLDFENDLYTVPLGIGIGKVVSINKTILNFFIEPQYTIYYHGVGQPVFQIFSGLNIQFKT